jgi:ABC-type uncharacterized transport system permease subunit
LLEKCHTQKYTGFMILSTGTLFEGMSHARLALSFTSLLALLGYCTALSLSGRFAGAVRTALLLGWLAHGVSLVWGLGGWGTQAAGVRFGFAPVLSMTLWLVLAVYMLESRFVHLPGVRRALAALGGAVLLLAWVYPGELQAHVVSPWAPLHWLLGIASYGLFGVAVLHAALLSRAERQMRPLNRAISSEPQLVPLLQLERMTFRFVTAGFVVLSAALALGFLHASPWHWDHKSVFSMLGWLVFAALLTGRRAFGWRGVAATRFVYAGAVLLLLAYVGSRFVLEVFLHRSVVA